MFCEICEICGIYLFVNTLIELISYKTLKYSIPI